MSALSGEIVHFSPRLPWLGGDLQTIRNYAVTIRRAVPGQASERIEFALDDGDRLVGVLHLPNQPVPGRPLVLLIHGLAGSERSGYMLLSTCHFVARGYPVLRINLRGAGPSRFTCRTHYHAGKTDDFAALLERLDPALVRHGVLPIGFSLGGNLLLKYLGEHGSNTPLVGAATVSSPLDLAITCRELMRWRNYGYHRFILANLRRACVGPSSRFSAAEQDVFKRARSLWEIDDRVTAPRNGFASADMYYEANSSQAYLARIRVPTVLIHAKDDPFVPVAPYYRVRWQQHPALTPVITRTGGHLGFHEPRGVWYLNKIERALDLI